MKTSYISSEATAPIVTKLYIKPSEAEGTKLFKWSRAKDLGLVVQN